MHPHFSWEDRRGWNCTGKQLQWRLALSKTARVGRVGRPNWKTKSKIAYSTCHCVGTPARMRHSSLLIFEVVLTINLLLALALGSEQKVAATWISARLPLVEAPKHQLQQLWISFAAYAYLCNTYVLVVSSLCPRLSSLLSRYRGQSALEFLIYILCDFLQSLIPTSQAVLCLYKCSQSFTIGLSCFGSIVSILIVSDFNVPCTRTERRKIHHPYQYLNVKSGTWSRRPVSCILERDSYYQYAVPSYSRHKWQTVVRAFIIFLRSLGESRQFGNVVLYLTM